MAGKHAASPLPTSVPTQEQCPPEQPSGHRVPRQPQWAPPGGADPATPARGAKRRGSSDTSWWSLKRSPRHRGT